MALAELVTSLASNPYFSAGFGLFGVGSAAAVGRSLVKISAAVFRRHYITTLQVPCNDKVTPSSGNISLSIIVEAYHWLLDWISREAGQTSQHLSLRTEWEEEEGGDP